MAVRILIADDNPSVRNAMRWVLEAEHWQIIEAKNGAEAVSKAAELRPDLVVMDLVMPVMNGLIASRKIALLLPHVPIVMHTCFSSPQVDFEASKAGVRRVVAKSESGVLVSAVQALLVRRPAGAGLGATLEAAQPDSSGIAMRRVGDRVCHLCAELFASKDDADHEGLLAQLQNSLHKQIEDFRARLAEYPFISERRGRKETPK